MNKTKLFVLCVLVGVALSLRCRVCNEIRKGNGDPEPVYPEFPTCAEENLMVCNEDAIMCGTVRYSVFVDAIDTELHMTTSACLNELDSQSNENLCDSLKAQEGPGKITKCDVSTCKEDGCNGGGHDTDDTERDDLLSDLVDKVHALLNKALDVLFAGFQ